jgi:ribonuclease P protein component
LADLGQGLPRTARLLKPADFRRVFQRARRAQDANFTILARANDGNPARLGLAIARKQVRRAVDRNRLKRLIRDSFRHRRAELHGLDLVVMARSRAVSATNAELFESLAELWQNLLSSSAA